MPFFKCKKLSMLQAIILPALLALTSVQSSADIYKYVDDSGAIVFTNVPRSTQKKIETVVREKAPASRQTKTDQPKTEAAKTAQPDKANNADGAKPKEDKKYWVQRGMLDDDVPYGRIINSKCDKYNVDSALVKSIIKAESNYNPQAVSPKGARGLMQLMPTTASDMGVERIFDPEQNIEGGVKYLRYLLDSFKGDVELSVAAYNCGEGKVVRNGMCVPAIAETKNYVRKVMRLSKNPVTGARFSRPIYKVELKDGSILFTESPTAGSDISLVE